MKRYIVVNLLNKDDKLKTWYKSLGDSNGSKIACCAIIYYEKTGKYLNIGKLTALDIGMPNARKQIYIPNQGKAREIIERWGQEDNRVSTKVKHILNMGITITDELDDNHVISEDEAIAAVEAVSNNHMEFTGNSQADVQNAPVIADIDNEKDTVKKDVSHLRDEPEKVIPPVNDNNISRTRVESERYPQKKTTSDKPPEMERRTQDLIAAMLGNGCGLGNS